MTDIEEEITQKLSFCKRKNYTVDKTLNKLNEVVGLNDSALKSQLA